MDNIIDKIEIKAGDCAVLATEVWRLSRTLSSLQLTDGGSSGRYSIRQLSRLLDVLEISLLDVTGQPYDTGLVQEVIDIVEDEALPHGHQVIEEVVTPTVMLRGNIVQTGQITIRRSSK